MTDDRILDVRTEPPVRRHTVIFEAFEALDPGAAFELVNDHDPKPLYYQFAAERPETLMDYSSRRVRRSGGPYRRPTKTHRGFRPVSLT